MSERKTEAINLRMSPRVKELLRLAAAHERRTLSNMMEVLIEGYCETHNLDAGQTHLDWHNLSRAKETN